VSAAENKAILYGGDIHFSKDTATDAGLPIFGAGFEVTDEDSPWPESAEQLPFRLTGLSQEHGIITGDAEAIARLKPGSLVAIHPAHSCLTMRQFGHFYTLDGLEEQTMN